MHGICRRLETIHASEATAYGNKAAVLGELSQRGIEVPTGYVIPVASFDRILEDNGLPYRPDDYAACSPEIRECIQAFDLGLEVEDTVGRCIEEMGTQHPQDRLIVRTSALCEDSRSSSMAGAFASFPGIDTLQEVCDAIRGCYESLFSEAVLDRFAAGRISRDELKAGVIIQRYVEGEVSGVTFTADLKEMDPGKIHISAVNGSCSGLTSGSEPVTIYTWDRTDEALEGVAGDDELLDEAQITRLVESAVRIESIAGYYQDIEWTMAGEDLHVLQSRPVTGFRRRVEGSEWEDAGASEAPAWALKSDTCLPPLIAELVVEAENQTGACAYSYGMHWDSVESAARNGYVYQRPREITDAKGKLDAFLARINGQFDQGEDEFDKYVKPELSKLIEGIHERYIDRTVDDAALPAYLDEAEHFMKRSLRLHWRATTSEWYMAHFFKKRVERFYDSISVQDLVDLVYSKSLMSAEREELYGMVAVIQKDPVLRELFTHFEHDRIIDARLGRMSGAAVDELMGLIEKYSAAYGWLYPGTLEDGELCCAGRVSRVECINRIRRYLHVSIEEYQANLLQMAENAERLRAVGSSNCESDEDRTAFETAVQAGEKAFLAGDNHAFFICSRKFVYICDALRRIGALFHSGGKIDSPDDVRFLRLAEIRSHFPDDTPLHALIAERKALHADWSGVLPPERIGEERPDDHAKDTPDEPGDAKQVIKGESGTRRNARGKVHVGFPKGMPGDDVILVLDHGHEGDLTTMLRHVAGFVLRMGSPACHMGIIARELGIPAIYGIGDQANLLESGQEVEIRGETGEIVLLG